MKGLRDTRLLFGRSGLELLRNPVWLVVGFSTPILYLALFTPLLHHAPGLGHGSVLDEFLPGILSLVAFASGSASGFTTIFELRAGVIERLRVTPASRAAILLGPILASMTLMLVFDMAVVAVGVAFGFHLHWLGLLTLGVLLCLLMIAMAAFSVTTALATRDISSFAAVINGLNLPLLLLAGVLLPISLGPLWLRILAHLNPLYYLVAASRTLSAGAFGGPHVWQAFAVLVPVCGLAVIRATSVFRHAVA